MTNELVPTSGMFIAPVIDVANALRAYQAMKDFVSGVLREEVDFGVIPGTDKPTLYKPGAEKLARFFGLSILVNQMEIERDWTGEKHNGEPFFYFQYKAIAARNGMTVAEGIGSCSTWEPKYRYRNAQRVCPSCGQTAIIKGKEEYGGGWICFGKKGGCGAKFKINDPQIAGQEVGKINNPDPAEIVNTVDKMAQKRAIIAVVLLACNASEYFTQDLDDYIPEGEVTEPNPKKKAGKPEPAQTHAPITTEPDKHADISHSGTPEPPQNVVQDEMGGNGKGTAEPPAKEYSGPLVMIGKHKYPMSWSRELMPEFVATGKIELNHLDNILQKLAMTAASEPDAVVAKVAEYLANKEAA